MSITNIIITADWHIRIKADIDEDWQIDRYRQLTNAVVQQCTMHDAILILAGDILDRNRPSLMETQLMLELFQRLEYNKIHTYLISGNHDRLGVDGSTYDHWTPYMDALEYVHYNTSNTMFIPGDTIDLYLAGHPVLQSHDHGSLRKDRVNILVSHFRPTINQFIQEELDVAKFIKDFDYCFAGDIHMPVELFDGKLIYVNHPLNSCFEAKPQCGVVLVEPTKQGIHWSRIEFTLPNLIQETVEAINYEESEDTYNFKRVEVQGTPDELRKIATDKNNIKLLKVPVVVDTYIESTQELEDLPGALEEALILYMQELGIPQDEIAQMIAVYRERED